MNRFFVAIRCLGLLLLGGVAAADENTAEGVSIDAQPLASALREFSEQTGLQIGYAAELAEGKATNGIASIEDPELALDQLLASSGLEHRFVNDSTVIIREATVTDEEGGDRDSGNAGPTPVLMAQNVANQTATSTERSRRSDEGGISVVTGKVTDARTGANLKGAKVTIEESGQWTSTNHLGEFRLVNVPTGNATLTVSYLGYAGQSTVVNVRANGASHDFTLRVDGAIEEIVVFGQRSARAQALNLERTAENSSTVVSADLLGNFTGTTLSEALRRAPGVAFEQDFDTGDGTDIVVRGLGPDLNVIRFNGIELPDGSATGRTASLSSILAGTVDRVTISQTLLPNQDSGGTGGLVEIETASALDRPDTFARFSINGRQRDEDFVDDYVVDGQFSRRFGKDDNFGIGGSVQYRDREQRTITAGPTALFFGAYLPRDPEGGLNIFFEDEVPPGNPWPFFDTPGAADVYPQNLQYIQSVIATETAAYGLNMAWRWAPHSEFRIDYQRIEEEAARTGSSYSFSPSNFRFFRPVVARGGEELVSLTDEFGFEPRIFQELENSTSQTDTDILTLQGSTVVDRFEFDYSAGFTTSSNDRSNRELRFTSSASLIDWDDAAFLDPNAVDPIEGIVLSPFAPISPEDDAVPVPRFTEAGFLAVNDQLFFPRFRGTDGQTFGESDRYSVEFSARYNVERGFLRYVEVGFDYEATEFTAGNLFGGIGAGSGFGSLADLGVGYDSFMLGDVGSPLPLRVFSDEAASRMISSLDAFVANGLFVVDPLEPSVEDFSLRSEETEFAPFFQGRLDIGDFEVIAGVRYSGIEVTANDLDRPSLTVPGFIRDEQFAAENTVFRTESVTQNRWLPRAVVNYRPNEKIVGRFGYSRAVARPQLSLISGPRTYNLNLALTAFGLPGTLTVVESNEDLRPTVTDSFDLSLEYYTENSGAYKVSLFYKEFDNIVEQNLPRQIDMLPADTILPDFSSAPLIPDGFDLDAAIASGDVEVRFSRPVNNPDSAEISGVQLSVEQQFPNLPGIWSGLGFFANYTYTDSSKTIRTLTPVADGEIEFVVEGVPFNSDPTHSGTVAATYNAFDIDASLTYSFQDRALAQFVGNNLSEYREGLETLDFRFAYGIERWGGYYQLVFEGVDLMRDPEDPATINGEGDSQFFYTSRAFRGGREFRLGLIATF